MNSLTDWESIDVDLDYKPDKVLVSHGENAELRVEIDIVKTRQGGRYINIRKDVFGVKNILLVEVFEKEVASLLSFEEEVAIWANWGVALNIMISRSANAIGIDKRLMKDIITLGERHGLLIAAHNNTWKVTDKIIKSRWLDKSKSMIKVPKKEETTQETLDRLFKRDKINKEEEEEGMGHESGSDVESETEKDIPIIVIEPPKALMNIELLKKQLDTLKKKYHDPDFVEDETETKNTLLAKINAIKVTISNAEIQQASKYTNVKGVKLTESGSIINITQAIKHVPIQKVISGGIKSVKPIEPQKGLIPVKKIPSKGKPAPAKRVRKT
jgi:hypothetical protein